MTLEWILGRCDTLRSEVFLRAAFPPGIDASTVHLAATLTGPACRWAITLPVTATFSTVPPGLATVPAQTIVTRAVLTEPSFWTPELPSTYQLDAQLMVAGTEVASWSRAVGLRRLGIRGRSLWLDGRRYVPRGLVVSQGSVDIDQFHDAAVAAVVADPSDDLLQACDAQGIAVVGMLASENGEPRESQAAAECVARWAWHPSVFMAVVPVDAADGTAGHLAAETRSRRGTLLVAQEVDGSRPPPARIDGVDALVVALAGDAVPHEAWRRAPVTVPLLARRVTSPATFAAPTRRPCDALQAALAAWATGVDHEPVTYDWAGYFAAD